jgi:hypothetical protein
MPTRGAAPGNWLGDGAPVRVALPLGAGTPEIHPLAVGVWLGAPTPVMNPLAVGLEGTVAEVLELELTSTSWSVTDSQPEMISWSAD